MKEWKEAFSQYKKGGFDVRDEYEARTLTYILVSVMRDASGIPSREREEMALDVIRYVLHFKLRLSVAQTKVLSTLLEASQRPEIRAQREEVLRTAGRKSKIF